MKTVAGEPVDQPVGAAGRRGPLGRLTPRERDVLALVARGLTDAAIAGRLGIAEATVHKHLEHVYRKLSVTNRVSATITWLASA
jgi:DNA-binding NarL/FixJ family response regulator